MCRVLLADNKFIKTMGFANMLTLLHRLEKECGGDGNGYVLLKNGELIGYDKGVKLTNEEIVTQLFMAEPDWFMYHTRIASAGSVSDTNCHPYVSKDKKFALEMNGTDTSFSDLANDYGCTDTYMIFKLFNSNRKSLIISFVMRLYTSSIRDFSICFGNYFNICSIVNFLPSFFGKIPLKGVIFKGRLFSLTTIT